MRSPAQTPEELETLLEDAFVVRDRSAVADLFEDGAVLVAGREAHGTRQIASLASAMWERGGLYLAEPQRVIQTRTTALVLARRSVNVLRRADRGWRYAISLLDTDNPDERKQP